MLKVARTAKSVLLTPKGAQKLPSAIETGISGNEELAEVGEGGEGGAERLDWSLQILNKNLWASNFKRCLENYTSSPHEKDHLLELFPNTFSTFYINK